MTENSLFNLSSRWARVGAMFLTPPTAALPDLEQQLLDTARHASEDSRLFIMAASWLAKHGCRVQPGRLSQAIAEQLEPEFRPVMGLLLDHARQFSGGSWFDAAIAQCEPAREPRPLFKIERNNPTLRRIAERRASTHSRKWNLWAPDFEPKYNAIRPEEWVNSALGVAPLSRQRA